MIFNIPTSRNILIASALMLGMAAAPASAASFGPGWAALHTEAPSHFSAPIQLIHPGPSQQAAPTLFTAPAEGPAGAQFGRLPATNTSFVDPTRNSLNAHQTQNSVQATNTMESTQAVQGRNCSLNAIRAGLCQGR